MTIEFTNTVDIDRPSAEVFAYLVDLGHVPEWNHAIEATEQVTPGEVSVGTQFRQVRSEPVHAVEQLTVTGLEPGRRLDVAGQIGPFDARLSYLVTDTPAGTRLTNAVELDPPGAARLLGGLLTGRIKASVGENLAVLKGVLEGTATRG
jgi:hypothetical protein